MKNKVSIINSSKHHSSGKRTTAHKLTNFFTGIGIKYWYFFLKCVKLLYFFFFIRLIWELLAKLGTA